MTRKNSTAYIVFTKNPILGKVKTRLAVDVGEEEALRIYTLMLHHTLKMLKSFPQKDVKIYINEWPQDNSYLAPYHEQVFIQTGEDLGAKMENALAEQLQEYSQVILFGCDIPELDEAALELASETLKNRDVVLGPSRDGGYYLIGMKKMHKEVFQNIPWSTEKVAKTTIHRFVHTGTSLFLTPTLGDVDYLKDWEQSRHILEKR